MFTYVQSCVLQNYMLGLPTVQKKQNKLFVGLFNDTQRQEDYLSKLEGHLPQNCFKYNHKVWTNEHLIHMGNLNVKYYQLVKMNTKHTLRGKIECSNFLSSMETIKKIQRY